MVSRRDFISSKLPKDMSKEVFVEELFIRSKYAGVGTVGRDIEVELRAMRKMATCAAQTCDLSESEINGLDRHIGDWRRMLISIEEEIDADQIEDVLDSEMEPS
jgi:hypothetical protein